MRRIHSAYFDTSVLVKRYLNEPGARYARELLRRYRMISSAIAPVEALSAIRRRKTAGDLTERSLRAILNRFHDDRSYWELVAVNAQVLLQAEDLIMKSALRTLDALHIASALAFHAASGIRIPFITGDDHQRDVAARMDLNVMWVGSDH